MENITGQFKIVINERSPRVVSLIKIKMERGETTSIERLEKVAGGVKDFMSSKRKIRPKIMWLEPKELAGSIYKGKFFEKTSLPKISDVKRILAGLLLD